MRAIPEWVQVLAWFGYRFWLGSMSYVGSADHMECAEIDEAPNRASILSISRLQTVFRWPASCDGSTRFSTRVCPNIRDSVGWLAIRLKNGKESQPQKRPLIVNLQHIAFRRQGVPPNSVRSRASPVALTHVAVVSLLAFTHRQRVKSTVKQSDLSVNTGRQAIASAWLANVMLRKHSILFNVPAG